MARPERRDADYFPFYCKDGRTLFILEGKYQCKGTGFFTNVMRFLTMEKDHYVCLWKDADRLFFFSKAKCDEESAMDMLGFMVTTGKIDRDLWEKHRVIFSQDLVDSLADAYRRRRNQIITIQEVRDIFQAKLSTGKNNKPENDGNNHSNSGDNPVDEGFPAAFIPKGKERKGKERILCVYTDAFIAFWNVYPKKNGKKAAFQEWEKAKDKPPLKDILSAIENQKRSKAKAKESGQFVPEWPDPERWIKKARWEDEIKEPQNEAAPQRKPTMRCQKCEALFYHLLRVRGMDVCQKCAEEVGP